MTKKLVSPSGWTRYFFGDPSSNKLALNAAVAHGPQHLNAALLNVRYYEIWRDSVYGDLRGIVRLKAQIHDSILFCWRGEGTPELVRSRMDITIPVTGTDRKTRQFSIPTDMSYQKKDKQGNVIGPAIYWSDMK